MEALVGVPDLGVQDQLVPANGDGVLLVLGEGPGAEGGKAERDRPIVNSSIRHAGLIDLF